MRLEQTKDFTEYAVMRAGLPPRDILARHFSSILDKAIKLDGPIVVAEFGFSHGNDARYIISMLKEKCSERDWQYWGYDHKDYFMPDNVIAGNEAVSENIHLIPCFFEDIAEDKVEMPDGITIVYSSKSLSLCDSKMLKATLNKITNRIVRGGVMLCTMHVRNQESDKFPETDYYLNILRGVGDNSFFSTALTYYAVNKNKCTFAFVSYSGKENQVTHCPKIISDNDDEEYAKAASLIIDR